MTMLVDIIVPNDVTVIRHERNTCFTPRHAKLAFRQYGPMFIETMTSEEIVDDLPRTCYRHYLWVMLPNDVMSMSLLGCDITIPDKAFVDWKVSQLLAEFVRDGGLKPTTWKYEYDI